MDTQRAEECAGFRNRDLCADLDADCDPIVDKLWCWMHDPTQGECPWLIGHPEYRL